MRSIKEILSNAVEKKAADIFMIPGMPLAYKVGSRIESQEEEKLTPKNMEPLIEELYGQAGNRDMEKVKAAGDDDFSFGIQDLSRFRANVF